jgi:hypothetical protein
LAWASGDRAQVYAIKRFHGLNCAFVQLSRALLVVKDLKQLAGFSFLASLRQAKIGSASTNSDNTIFRFSQQKTRLVSR